jgi:hypothetical protein
MCHHAMRQQATTAAVLAPAPTACTSLRHPRTCMQRHPRTHQDRRARRVRVRPAGQHVAARPAHNPMLGSARSGGGLELHVGGPESNTAARPAHNPMLGSARSGGGLGLHVGGEQLSYAEQLTAQWERVRTDPRVRILQILPSMLLETVAAKLDIRAAARLAQTCSAANRAVQTMAENRVTALNVSKQWLITAMVGRCSGAASSLCGEP